MKSRALFGIRHNEPLETAGLKIKKFTISNVDELILKLLVLCFWVRVAMNTAMKPQTLTRQNSICDDFTGNDRKRSFFENLGTILFVWYNLIFV